MARTERGPDAPRRKRLGRKEVVGPATDPGVDAALAQATAQSQQPATPVNAPPRKQEKNSRQQQGLEKDPEVIAMRNRLIAINLNEFNEEQYLEEMRKCDPIRRFIERINDPAVSALDKADLVDSYSYNFAIPGEGNDASTKEPYDEGTAGSYHELLLHRATFGDEFVTQLEKDGNKYVVDGRSVPAIRVVFKGPTWKRFNNDKSYFSREYGKSFRSLLNSLVTEQRDNDYAEDVNNGIVKRKLYVEPKEEAQLPIAVLPAAPAAAADSEAEHFARLENLLGPDLEKPPAKRESSLEGDHEYEEAKARIENLTGIPDLDAELKREVLGRLEARKPAAPEAPATASNPAPEAEPDEYKDDPWRLFRTIFNRPAREEQRSAVMGEIYDKLPHRPGQPVAPEILQRVDDFFAEASKGLPEGAPVSEAKIEEFLANFGAAPRSEAQAATPETQVPPAAGTEPKKPEAAAESRKEQVSVPLSLVENVVKKKLSEQAKITTWEMRTTPAGLQVRAELGAGILGGNIKLDFQIVNKNSDIAIEGLDIDARWYVRSGVEKKLSSVITSVKQVLEDQTGKKVTKMEIVGSALVVEFDSPQAAEPAQPESEIRIDPSEVKKAKPKKSAFRVGTETGSDGLDYVQIAPAAGERTSSDQRELLKKLIKKLTP